MPLSACDAGTTVFRVEVSGWDAAEAFFVETSQLTWSEHAGKKVILSRMLSHGALLFVRLLLPDARDRSHPVAYRAEFVNGTPIEQKQFRLKQLHPMLEPKKTSPS